MSLRTLSSVLSINNIMYYIFTPLLNRICDEPLNLVSIF